MLSYLISGFYPVYLCRSNTVYINGVQYRQDPLSDWQPTGAKFKIGNLCGGVPLLTFLYKYNGDNNQFFAYIYSFPSDAEAMPYHRMDVPLPSFTADVIDSISFYIESDMTPDNMEDKEITITDKKTIGEIADCFNRPVAKDETKEIVGTSIGLTAQSAQYEDMTYKIRAVAYDGKFCFMQADGSLFEIPIELLEKLFDVTISTPEQYVKAKEVIDKMYYKMWRSVNENGTFYLFMWRDDYIIIEAKEEKALLKESGLYKVDHNKINFYPDNKLLDTYSYIYNLDDMGLTSLDTSFFTSWTFDEEDSIVLEHDGSMSRIEQIASSYSREAFSLRN